MLPPPKSDRIITHMPKCFSPNAALQTKEVFHPQVKAACQTLREDTVSFNVAKVIVVGDVSVGKTCLVSRFSRGAFNKNYKATIGVDFDMERFQVLGVPFSLQLWDTAGQERFKCIASTYYRGAQGQEGSSPSSSPNPTCSFVYVCVAPTAIIVVFDLSRANSLDHAREWLEDAMKENDPSSVLLFLVGTKKDLSSPEQLGQVEEEAVRMSEEIRAEYWAVSAKSGDGVRDFFLRVASLTFEANVLAELEKSAARDGADVISESLARRLSSTPVLTWFVARDHERPEGQTREEGQLLLT
ncbi:ras-related protein Rab-34-like isoform X2 [Syngnathus typhle]|uniref:ras-related protein Rab-34-like isoform X2 n=1 Tax=Syngnathus typhle TaxID=161592 RepID=UPI002A6B0EA7|nr:ras-related protein Rab-34-like isoform X2 [Syngnathus typhle]XP_061155114.1 ras-related protein Rab-34-like isoform X2 [Syngnathus typhle]